MAGFFQDLLKDTAGGFFGSEYVRDYTHASKTFRTNSYAYAPKYKFLFHVEFQINRDLIGAKNIFPEDANFGLAVKTINLPKFSVDLHEMNQYNRRRVIQTKLKYDPVSITFHDDNANLIRQLWYTYYTYYYNDANHKESNLVKAFQDGDNIYSTANKISDITGRNIYDPSITGNDDWGYIGETSTTQQSLDSADQGRSKAPFFRSIDIYGFNQHNYVMYRLLNPIIESFGHDTYDYSQANGVMENQMGLRYEAVKYYNGAIDGRQPSNIISSFGTDAHYDKTLSPIARPGSQANILGQGGLIAGAGGIMDDLSSGNILGAIQKAGATYNTFKNPGTLTKALKGEILGGITNAVQGTPNRNNAFSFPTFGQSINKTVTQGGGPSGSLTKPPPAN